MQYHYQHLLRSYFVLSTVLCVCLLNLKHTSLNVYLILRFAFYIMVALVISLTVE